MEEELYTLLSGAVAWDIAWMSLGEDARLPRGVITRVSGQRDMTLNGPGLMQATVQIDVFDDDNLGALTAGREIRAALEGYRGGVILGAFLTTIQDFTDDDAGLLFRVSMRFAITYREN